MRLQTPPVKTLTLHTRAIFKVDRMGVKGTWYVIVCTYPSKNNTTTVGEVQTGTWVRLQPTPVMYGTHPIVYPRNIQRG